MDQLAVTNTVDVVIDNFLAEYVRGTDALRSADQIERAFDVYVRPRIGAKSIYDLQRSDVQAMLAEIAKEHGPVMADRVLAYVRKAFNWQMIDDDKFNSPIVRGMARTKPKQRARKRTLSDVEIRDVWIALETANVPECYPRFLKSLLFNATRRNESSRMHSTEVEGEIWVIPGSRYKTKLDHALPLTDAFRELIGEKPAACRGKSWFIFSTTNGVPEIGISSSSIQTCRSGRPRSLPVANRAIRARRVRTSCILWARCGSISREACISGPTGVGSYCCRAAAGCHGLLLAE